MLHGQLYGGSLFLISLIQGSPYLAGYIEGSVQRSQVQEGD